MTQVWITPYLHYSSLIGTWLRSNTKNDPPITILTLITEEVGMEGSILFLGL